MSFLDIKSEASDRIRDRCGREIPPLLMFQYASEANVDFVRRSESVRGQWKRALVAGQGEYDMPYDCIRPTRVSVQYADDEDEDTLVFVGERRMIDGLSRTIEGRPSHWYLSDDRRRFGLHHKPTEGGLVTYATAAGSTTAITIDNTDASDTDDFYNDLTVRVLDGVRQGEESIVTDYDGTTHILTISPALTGAVGSGARIEIGSDTIVMQYIKRGNECRILPTTSTVSATVTNSYSTFTIGAFASRPIDFLYGAEIFFTADTKEGAKCRVTASKGNGTACTVTVEPELWFMPTSADPIRVVDVPNAPPEWHHALADYVVAKVMQRYDKGFAAEVTNRYERSIVDAKKLFEPLQGEEYRRVREHSYGGG